MNSKEIFKNNILQRMRQLSLTKRTLADKLKFFGGERKWLYRIIDYGLDRPNSQTADEFEQLLKELKFSSPQELWEDVESDIVRDFAAVWGKADINLRYAIRTKLNEWQQPSDSNVAVNWLFDQFMKSNDVRLRVTLGRLNSGRQVFIMMQEALSHFGVAHDATIPLPQEMVQLLSDYLYDWTKGLPIVRDPVSLDPITERQEAPRQFSMDDYVEAIFQFKDSSKGQMVVADLGGDANFKLAIRKLLEQFKDKIDPTMSPEEVGKLIGPHLVEMAQKQWRPEQPQEPKPQLTLAQIRAARKATS